MNRAARLLGALALTIGLTPAATAQRPDLYDMDTVRTIYLTFNQANYWTQLVQNKSAQIEIKADMTVDNVTLKDVGVRFRGNTSYSRLPTGSRKMSFNIRTDSFVPNQDIYGYDHLNLNNGYHDPTFLREAMLYAMCRRYMPCSKANWVKLYINNEYWGIYINVQQPNSQMFDEWFRDGSGNRYRGFPSTGFGFSNTVLNWLGFDIGPYQAAYQFKKGDGTDLRDMINVLNNTPIANLETELPKWWSVDQGWWYFICMNAFLQTDSYLQTGKDHSEYVDPTHGRVHIYPFDLNEGLGAELNPQLTLSPYYRMTASNRPAMSRPYQIAKWKARYDAHYRTVVRETYSWSGLFGQMAQKYHAMIAADVAADNKKIYTTQQFQTNLTSPVQIGRSTVPGIKQLIDTREAYLKSQPLYTAPEPTITNLTRTPVAPTSSQTTWITAQVSNAQTVTLYYRVQGPFIEAPMFDDGQHGDGAANDGVWGAGIPPQPSGTFVDYYAGAATAAGVIRFLPATAEFKAPNYFVAYPTGPSAIEINEFVARNNTGIQDENMEFEDWVELRNTSNQPVDVTGMYLSDKADNATKWAIPARTVIPGGGTLLIWCDEDGQQGLYHANFKLSANGETLFLFDTDGLTLLDSVTFGPQPADESTGRMLGYGNVWARFPSPTPRADNTIAPCGHFAYERLDATASPIALAGTGTPQVGGVASYAVSNAPASSAGVFAIGVAPAQIDLGIAGSLLVNPSVLVLLPFTADLGGNATPTVPVPNSVALAGQAFYLQAFAASATAGGLSNGVMTVICP